MGDGPMASRRSPRVAGQRRVQLSERFAVTEPLNVKRATLAAVASEAGVSLPTVSRVLNNTGAVSPETRSRVEQVLRQLDYVPRPTRHPEPGLRSVELVFEAYNNPYFGEVLYGAANAGDEAGMDI